MEYGLGNYRIEECDWILYNWDIFEGLESFMEEESYIMKV